MNSRPPFEAHRKDLDKILRILQDTPAIDREYMAVLRKNPCAALQTTEMVGS